MLWSLCLRFGKYLPNRLLEKEAVRHCSVMCQLTQRVHGGVIVSTVKSNHEGHFMNMVDDVIFDGFGNIIKGSHVAGDTIDFGNGKYTIVEIKKSFSDFNIKSVKGLLAYTEMWANRIKRSD